MSVGVSEVFAYSYAFSGVTFVISYCPFSLILLSGLSLFCERKTFILIYNMHDACIVQMYIRIPITVQQQLREIIVVISIHHHSFTAF